MMRALLIDALVAIPVIRRGAVTLQYSNVVTFLDSELRDPLPGIADAIMAFYQDPAARNSLPGLFDGEYLAEASREL